MAQPLKTYKDYLHSCNIEDVSPRVLRRLNINRTLQPRNRRLQPYNFKINFQENITLTRKMKNFKYTFETLCENEISSIQEDETNIAVPMEITEQAEKGQEEKADIIDKIENDEYRVICNNNRFIENGLKTYLVKDIINETQQDMIDNGFHDAHHEIHCMQDQYLEFDEELLNDLRDDGNIDNHYSPNNLQNFISRDDFLNAINSSVNRSRGEIFLMMLKHVLKFKSSLSEFCNLLHIINLIFSQSILPDSRWILDNILNPKTSLQFHGICPTCSKYIGEIKDFSSSVICEMCSVTIDLKCPSCSNIFVLINPVDSIKLLIEENQKYYKYVTMNRSSNGQIRDIFDGEYYKSFKRNLPIEERHDYATVIFNTDGAPRFESSAYSIWPIYLQLNEIPIETRLKNILTCGMWFGKDKPEMTAFLQPFTSIINQLSTEGIKCVINNEEHLIKVYALISCVDSVARAPMQGLQLFNGRYGCNWCLQEGLWYEGSMRYLAHRFEIEERTNTNMIEFMKQITNKGCNGHIYGVKNFSPLINLPCFNVAKGFVPDYMHCCLVGVGKQITNAFLKSIPRYRIEELNAFLISIKVPHQIGRASRSLDEIANWKAKEWENFILYYSSPIFHEVLNKRLFKYWTLFVQSLHTLLSCNISIPQLNKVDEDLRKFVFLTQRFFLKEAMTYNIHQLLHLSESVFNWGPLHCHSTFPFESANHDLLQAIHCAKGVNLQIVRYINMQHSLNVIRKHIYPNASPLVIKYCEELSSKHIKKCCKLSSITYLGKEKSVDENVLRNFGVDVNTTVMYERMIKNSCLFMSSNRKNIRSDNSFAILSTKTFIRIRHFLIDKQNKKEITLCNVVNISTAICHFIYEVCSIENELVAVETNKIQQISVFMQIHEKSYIATLPNIYHY